MQGKAQRASRSDLTRGSTGSLQSVSILGPWTGRGERRAVSLLAVPASHPADQKPAYARHVHGQTRAHASIHPPPIQESKGRRCGASSANEVGGE